MRGVHVAISGRVQGVGFRHWVHGEARARGLCGWVRNRPDGSVEAVFFGPEHEVDAMLDACWQGPDLALVATVLITDTTERPSVFEVRPTA
jgi:acylphosphatase